jgi:hypothetical protein
MHNTARQTRENRTLTIDFQNEATYFQLLGDGKAFLERIFPPHFGERRTISGGYLYSYPIM